MYNTHHSAFKLARNPRSSFNVNPPTNKTENTIYIIVMMNIYIIAIQSCSCSFKVN